MEVWPSGRYITWRETYTNDTQFEQIKPHLMAMVTFFTGKIPSNGNKD